MTQFWFDKSPDGQLLVFRQDGNGRFMEIAEEVLAEPMLNHDRVTNTFYLPCVGRYRILHPSDKQFGSRFVVAMRESVIARCLQWWYDRLPHTIKPFVTFEQLFRKNGDLLPWWSLLRLLRSTKLQDKL